MPDTVRTVPMSELSFGVWCQWCDLPTAFAMTFAREADYQPDVVFTSMYCTSCARYAEGP